MTGCALEAFVSSIGGVHITEEPFITLKYDGFGLRLCVCLRYYQMTGSIGRLDRLHEAPQAASVIMEDNWFIFYLERMKEILVRRSMESHLAAAPLLSWSR